MSSIKLLSDTNKLDIRPALWYHRPMIKEVWKDIPGYEGFYEISTHGRIRRHLESTPHDGTYPGRMLCGTTIKNYRKVKLSKNGKEKMYFTHRLVALCFIPNPYNLAQVNHIDGIKENNNVSNLEWCTPRNNTIHAIQMGLRKTYGAYCHQSKLTDKQVLEIRQKYKTGNFQQKDLANKYRVTQANISAVILNRTWRHI